MSEDMAIPDLDRDKSYIGRYSEVISQVKMTTSDGSEVVIDLENIGQIHVRPWGSELADERSRSKGKEVEQSYIGIQEDRTIFSSCSGHDVMILELMAEHARKFYSMAIAEEEQREAEDQKKLNVPPPKIVTGAVATDSLNNFALK